jgi:hypothetical protein
LNNSYGKTAQNPRKYKEYCFTDHGEMPDKEWFNFLENANDQVRHDYALPIERCSTHDVWARPNPGTRFNNVGTGASITGAARAVLLEAKHNAIDPIYCDTDSLFCRDLHGVSISPTELGAWDIEETFDEVVIVGKKTYCAKIAGEDDCSQTRLKVRSKGTDLRIRPENSFGLLKVDANANDWRIANGKTWERYLDLLDDKIISVLNPAPTFNKAGAQNFITRRIKATAPRLRQPHATSSRIQNGAGKLA